jgi:putative redox protein
MLMKFLVESAGDVAGRVRLGTRELVFDQPASVRCGGDRGPSPLDVLVASVAACAHYFAAAFLQARGLPTDRLTIEVEADKESVPTPRIGRLAMKVRVPEGLSEQQLIGIERAIKRCPAYGTLAKSPALELSVEIARDSGSAGLLSDGQVSA